jgi:SAM-dependent methyltransferase
MAAVEPADADRYSIERQKWDDHAHRSAATVKPIRPDDTFQWAAHRDPLLAGAAAFLGDLRGRRVVEYGCGLGRFSVLLARAGASVSAFDISERSVEVARDRATSLGVADRIDFRVAAGEDLPYEDASFDLAFGKAVLHHLDPSRGAAELARVLRPAGRAAFSEPLGTNPVVVFARGHLAYPGKHERGADIPLRRSDIDAWTAPFREWTVTGIQLTSMVERGLGYSKTGIRPLRSLDDALLGRWPGLWPLCRYAMLTLVR